MAFDLGVIRDAGFDVVPTFRNPHVTIAFEGEIEAAVVHLFSLHHETIANPAFREEL